MSRIGILVMVNSTAANNNRRVLDISEFRAFTLAADYAPLVFINSNDSPERRLFSLLYECVNIGFGYSNLFRDNPQDLAAIVAARLMPSGWENNPRRSRYGGAKIDNRLILCLAASVQEDRTQYTSACRLLNIKGSAFDSLVKKAQKELYPGIEF
jgi:hypothetical protein